MKNSIHLKIFSILLVLSISTPVSSVTSTKQTHISNNAEKGLYSFNNGRYEDALLAWNDALGEYLNSGNKNGQANILKYKSDAYLAMGFYSKAIKNLKKSLSLAESAGNRQLVSSVVGSLGTAYMLSNRSDEAKELLEKTIKEERSEGRLYSAAIAGINFGNLLAHQNKFNLAISTFKQALLDAAAVDNKQLIVKGMVNISRAMIADKNKTDAIPYLRETMSSTIDLPPSHVKSYVFISISRLYSNLIELDNQLTKRLMPLASEALHLAIFSAKHNNDRRAMSYSHGYLGTLREQQGDYNDAMKYTRKASSYLKGLSSPEISYRWKWQEGRLLKRKGDVEQAINAYQHAVDDLQGVRHVIAISDRMKNKKEFKKEAGQLYMELADLILKNVVKIKDKKKIEQNLLQVRTVVEMLKSAELEDYFRDDCVAALQKKTKGVDDLGDQTAAIYPIIFSDRLEILLSLPNGMKRYTVKVSEDELNNEINRFRSRLEKRTTHQYKRHAMVLYNWLISPIEKDLNAHNVNTLVFIPDGAFRTIPLTALYDGKDFLVTKFAVATTPGLTLTDPKPLPRKNIKLLVAGLSDGVQGFPALPEVDSEVAKLDTLFDSTILKNTTFTENEMKDALKNNNYSIVHIASHGKFKQDVRNSFLLTYDGKINMDSLEKYMTSTKFRINPVELLTLSACQTAMGDDKAALGLGGIAVKAGARSALATLWYINDQASSLLIKDFYVNLKDESLSKARALQSAQISMIKDPRYKHPSYWAPFLLIGNWL